MSSKTLFAILAVLVVLAGIAYFSSLPERTPEAPVPPQPEEFSWKFEDAGYNETAYADTTKVTLTYGSGSHDVGTYLGSCAEIGSVGTQTLQEGEISAVQCWFAGSGDEIGVFFYNGTLVVRHGELQEPQGDGSPDFRGNFEEILEL